MQIFPSRKQLKWLLFDSESANACILTTSRSSADNYFILSCNSGGQFRNFKTFLEKSDPGNAGQRRLGVWLALKDFTWKVFGNLLVATFTTVILLMRIFGDIPRQGIWVLMELKSECIKNRLNAKSKHNATLWNQSWSNCGLAGYFNLTVKQTRKYLDRRFPIQALLENLQTSNWTFHFRVDKQKQIIILMAASPVSI